jgi:EmrB/QacA subfamily drug resistance transporter
MAPVRLAEPTGRWIIVATVLGSGIAFIDATIVNVALPRIGADLGADAAGLQWTVNAYTLTLAAFILLGGSLGDRLGRRRIYTLGVVWFAVGSAMCAAAPTAGVLVAARAVQGLGAALLTPGSLALIQASFRPQDRPRAIGLWAGLSGVAPAVAPFLGGWLLQVASWRWVFLINLPIAAVVVAVALRRVPESSDPGAARRLDVAGAGLSAVGLGGLTYAFTAWPARGGDDPLVLLALAVGVLGLAAFVLVERYSAAPMLPLHLFRSRAFSATNLATFLIYGALTGVFFFLVIQLQVVAGYSPLGAGLAELPVTLLLILFSARSGAIAERIGPRIPMTVGPLLAALGAVLLAGVDADPSYVTDVFPGVMVFGLGLVITVAPLTSTALGAVADRFVGIASGVNNAVARAAGLIAIAVLPLVSGVGETLLDPVTLAPAYRTAMLVCAGLLAAGGLVALSGVPSSYAVLRERIPASPP